MSNKEKEVNLALEIEELKQLIEVEKEENIKKMKKIKDERKKDKRYFVDEKGLVREMGNKKKKGKDTIAE